jgi:hypothetical protein
MRKRLCKQDIIDAGVTDPKRINFVIELSKDFDSRRAAAVSGYSADYGYTLRDDPEIQAALDIIIQYRLEASHITAEWVLMEAVDNHLIARQNGNISASNTALTLIAKHAAVDAFAAERVEIASDEAIKERLLRARKRLQTPPPSFI